MKNGWTFIEIVVVIGIVALLAAIVIPVAQKIKERSESPTVDANGHKWRIVTIEGCEYIACPASLEHDVLTHKGNCTNKIHSYKGE